MDFLNEFKEQIYKRMSIQEEFVYTMFEIIANRFIEGSENTYLDESKYLFEALESVWHYGQINELLPDQSFLYGSIWGCLNMLSVIDKKKKASQKSYNLAEKYKEDTSYQFVRSIYNHPGIQNKELAKACKVTPARISQIAHTAITDGMVTFHYVGKNKYYYLKTLGDNVYEIIKKKKKEIIPSDISNNYYVIFFNRKDINFNDKWNAFYPKLDNLINNNDLVCIAVAFGDYNQNIQFIEANKNERDNVLWEKQTKYLNNNSENFWQILKGRGMTRQNTYL